MVDVNLIDWSDSLSVGNDVLDAQHKNMLAIINELHQTLINGKSNKIMSSLLQDLVHYTQEHFSAEEAIFDKFDYPEAEAHKNQHKEFVKKISQFNDDFTRGKLTLSLDVMEFLVNWFLRHIQHTDQEYAKIIKTYDKESS